MRDRVGARSLLRSAKQSVPLWIDRLPELPTLTFEVLDQIKSGRLQVASNDPQLESIRSEIQRLHRRLSFAVVGVGLIIGAGVLNGVSAETSKLLGPLPISVWLLGGLGALSILAAFRAR